MRIVRKVVKLVLLAVLVLLILLISLVIWIVLRPAVPDNYTKTVRTGGEIEAAYLASGRHTVKYTEAEAPGDWKKFEIYYPEEVAESGDTYPVVVLVNGTGIAGSKYRSLFRHLASWGFIVLGTEDPSTCTGASADAALAWLLEENDRENSLFYKKVDLDNIGISGHSQGGVGVFNAVTVNSHSSLYKTAVALSPTNEEGAAALNMFYDLTRLSIPALLLAGTEGDFETKLVIPFEQMEKMYRRMDVPKAMARRTGSAHEQMLYEADGYVTAWLMWQLQGDETAARAFTGLNPELACNALYQDQRIDLE